MVKLVSSHDLVRETEAIYGIRPESVLVRAITASVQPELGRIAYTGSDFPHPIWFHFPQEGPDGIVQNRPGSDLDGLVSFWPNASGPEANRCSRIVGPGTGRTQPARNQFPTFRLGSVLPQTARIHCVQTSPDPLCPNQPGSDLVLADCVRFWPNGPGPEASRRARMIGPASDRIRIGSESDPAGLRDDI